MSIFLAKVTERDGDLRYPFSVDAATSFDAENLLREEGLVEDGGSIEIKELNEVGAARYERKVGDGKGIQEHLDFPWTDEDFSNLR